MRQSSESCKALSQTSWRLFLFRRFFSAAPAAPWSRPGSNRQPPPCKSGALPTELRPQSVGPGHARSALPGASGPAAAPNPPYQQRQHDRERAQFQYAGPVHANHLQQHLPGRHFRSDRLPVARPAPMGPTRFELVTSSLSGTRSNQLSYEPDFVEVRHTPPVGRTAGLVLQSETGRRTSARRLPRRGQPRIGGETTNLSSSAHVSRYRPARNPRPLCW